MGKKKKKPAAASQAWKDSYAIGSGGNYALAAARALFQETDYSAEQIVKKSLKIASEICVFTNGNITCETL